MTCCATRSPWHPPAVQLSPLKEFLKRVFHFRAPSRQSAAQWSRVPSLVDVLSMVDMALDRKENLARGFGLHQLRRVRRSIEFAIYHALEHSLSGRAPSRLRRRSSALRQLVRHLNPATDALISFNYDVIADIALAQRLDRGQFRAELENLRSQETSGVDYGVDFANVPRADSGTPQFPLLKLHGSFNWLQSRLTGDLYFGGMQKAVGPIYQPRDIRGRAAANLTAFFRRGFAPNQDLDDLEAVVVTPTHLKDLRNPHLTRIWRRAEECLRAADRIVFIGYSLPGDDLHVKYLLKRSLETREAAGSPAVVVVNKGRQKNNSVRANYERFFGREFVEYYGGGFDAWIRRQGLGQASDGRPRRRHR